MITHIGKCGIWGHFITYWKDPISQSLYKNNDDIASKLEKVIIVYLKMKIIKKKEWKIDTDENMPNILLADYKKNLIDLILH